MSTQSFAACSDFLPPPGRPDSEIVLPPPERPDSFTVGGVGAPANTSAKTHNDEAPPTLIATLGEKALDFVLGIPPHAGVEDATSATLRNGDTEALERLLKENDSSSSHAAAHAAASSSSSSRVLHMLERVKEHLPTPNDAVAGIISGLVCGLLMFVFCCVFAEIIYGTHPLLQKGLDLGVCQHTLTVLLSGMITVLVSQNRIAIAGPDITPALFLAQAAEKVAKFIAAKQEAGAHYHESAALTTVLVMIAGTTFFIGLIWIVAGIRRVTRAIEYMPKSVIAGKFTFQVFKLFFSARARGFLLTPPGTSFFCRLRFERGVQSDAEGDRHERGDAHVFRNT